MHITTQDLQEQLGITEEQALKLIGHSNQPYRTPAGVILIVGIMLIGSIILFGWQTSELVNTLYPPDTWMMQVMSVVALDGFYTLWSLVEMFWIFKSKKIEEMVAVMFWVCFGGSCLASIVQMVIFAGMHLHVAISDLWLWGCYITIALVTCADVACLVIMVRSEWPRPGVDSPIAKNIVPSIKKN
jgi:hypothetical protein